MASSGLIRDARMPGQTAAMMPTTADAISDDLFPWDDNLRNALCFHDVHEHPPNVEPNNHPDNRTIDGQLDTFEGDHAAYLPAHHAHGSKHPDFLPTLNNAERERIDNPNNRDDHR